MFQHILVRDPRVAVAACHTAAEVLFVVGSGVLRYFQVSAANKAESLKKQLTVDKIRKCSGGQQIPAPYWVTNLLLAWRKEGAVDVFEEVKRMIGNGKIPVRLLEILYNNYCTRRNTYDTDEGK